MNVDQLPKYAFVCSLLLAAFACGAIVTGLQIFPYSILKQGFDAARDWQKNWQAYLHVEPTLHLMPALYNGDGVVEYDRDLAYPGQTLITSTWRDNDDWFNGFRLLDMKGNVLNEWRISPEDVWNEEPYHDPDTGSHWGKWKTDIHGSVLLPNGDIIFNFEYLGLVRINACSDVIWKLNYRTHHSAFQDDQGNIWAPRRMWLTKPDADYPGLVPPYIEETAIKVSPSGEILEEVSLVASFYESGYEGLLFSRKEGGKTISQNVSDGDFLHLNDVEVLSSKKAAAFDDFDAGDIMVSFRHINTILVLDGSTKEIKWAMPHAFIGQHDPDFTSRGTITVFDNRTGEISGEPVFDGSRVVEIDPSQNMSEYLEVLAPRSPETRFYTGSRGKHQELPNGNLLIAEYEGGRIFEMTPTGEVVWTYINKWDDSRVAKIAEGSRYSINPEVFKKLDCR